MHTDTPTLSNNALAFLALSNEYCQALEDTREAERLPFVENMLRLLPRIYIAATDLPADQLLSDAYIAGRLDEDYYDAVRRGVENLLGPDDTYLEVFEEDMKYSDTPIAASVSEGLADIFQVLYNLLDAVRDMPTAAIAEALTAVKDDFEAYWGMTLCNVMRALNHIRYTSTTADE